MNAILLKTEIPGPCSRELMKQRDQAVPRAIRQAAPVFIRQASGAILEDVDGNRFLDFASGIGVINVGHAPVGVQEAISRQAGRFLHTCFMVTPYESYVRLAERLNEQTPGRFPKKTFFVNSGAEAVENAIKIARYATHRSGIVCFEGAFHGRTLGSLALTNNVKPYKEGFGPFIGDVCRIPYGYCRRCAYHLKYPECKCHCATRLDEMLQNHLDPATVAAVIVEPVLGEGGFVVPPPEFLSTLQAICRARGILFIVDEIQSGFGRTGKLFASEWSGIEPDILLSAKSIAAGLPLAAVTGRAEIMDQCLPGGLGGTYGGNPVACEAALQVFEEFRSKDLLNRALHIGEIISARMRQWQTKFPRIGETRGVGAMQAMEIVRNRATDAPDKEAAGAVCRACFHKGLIVLTSGAHGNVIRFLPPLILSDDELNEGLDVIESALRETGDAPCR